MARVTKSKAPKKTPQKTAKRASKAARTSKAPVKRKRRATTPFAPAQRTAKGRATAKDPDALLALFTRPEGCTVMQLAEALGVTRQAATLRMRRFVDGGHVVATRTSAPSTFEELLNPSAHAVRTIVYRRAVINAEFADDAPSTNVDDGADLAPLGVTEGDGPVVDMSDDGNEPPEELIPGTNVAAC